MTAKSLLFYSVVAGTTLFPFMAQQASAAMELQFSTATISHFNGDSGGGFQQDFGPLPAFTSSFFQYSGVVNNGASTSTARMGLGIVQTPGYLGIGFATGTNLTQRNNADTSVNSAATLRADFDASWVNTGLTNYGTALQAGGSFGLVGNVPVSRSGSAFVMLNFVASFSITPPMSEDRFSLRGALSPSPFFSRALSGNFTFSRSDLVNAVPATIPPGYQLRVSGYIEFKVHNDLEEALLEADGPSGVVTGDDAQAFVPAPGAAGLLAFAGVFAMRRRR